MLEHIKNFCTGVLVIGGIILLSILVIILLSILVTYFPHIILSLLIVILFIGVYSIGREIREN
ncbi:hypothetical protein NCTC12673_gp150 [Campylobacter phage NCTC12673]|nr:hypothetical protein NCTC12673_gp150 [Campylobacter phage NCTC12673]AEA86493.1 hypothetical protein [Campylobacter phage NCTC12673]